MLSACWLLVSCIAISAWGQDVKSAPDIKETCRPCAVPKMTAQELAAWIDERFEKEYERLGVKPAAHRR